MRALVIAVLLTGAACATREAPRQPSVDDSPFVEYSEVEAAAAPSPHSYRGRPLCQACHAGRSAALLADANAVCARCHRFDHGNHPVAVREPHEDVGLPLGPGELVACHTCHDPHDLTRERKGLRLPFNELCVRCHPGH